MTHQACWKSKRQQPDGHHHMSTRTVHPSFKWTKTCKSVNLAKSECSFMRISILKTMCGKILIPEMLVTNDGSIVLCNDDNDVAMNAANGDDKLDPSTFNIEVVEIVPPKYVRTTANATMTTLPTVTNDMQSQAYQQQQIIETPQNPIAKRDTLKRRPPHMQPKHGGNDAQRFFCPRCGKDYSQSKNMRRHYRLECGQEPRYPCPFCKLRYKRNNQLKNHLITRHCLKVKEGNVYSPI